jgi:hypothetical protein
MDSDLERMIENTGVTLPLAARIVGLVLDSGASQIEISVALAIVGTTLNLLPVPLVSENVGAPELRPRET